MPAKLALLCQVAEHHTATTVQLEAACQEQLARAQLQMDNLKTESDRIAGQLVHQWQRHCDDMQQDMLAAHSAQHAAMHTAHEVALSKLQEDHAALVSHFAP